MKANRTNTLGGFVVFAFLLLLVSDISRPDWVPEETLATDIWTQTTSDSNQRDIAVHFGPRCGEQIKRKEPQWAGYDSLLNRSSARVDLYL